MPSSSTHGDAGVALIDEEVRPDGIVGDGHPAVAAGTEIGGRRSRTPGELTGFAGGPTVIGTPPHRVRDAVLAGPHLRAHGSTAPKRPTAAPTARCRASRPAAAASTPPAASHRPFRSRRWWWRTRPDPASPVRRPVTASPAGICLPRSTRSSMNSCHPRGVRRWATRRIELDPSATTTRSRSSR